MSSGRMEQLFLSDNPFSRIEALEREVAALARRASLMGRRYLADGWRRTDVAANLSASTMDRFGSSADAGLALGIGFQIVGLTGALNAARSAGSLAVDVYVGGTAAGVQIIFDGNNPQYAFTAAAGVQVAVGQEVTIRLTSTSGWTPTTADLKVGLLIEM